MGNILTKNQKIIIIGCGAGGGTAAQFARKTNRKAKITVFEKNSYPQYSKCGLPYAISGDIPKIMDLIEFSEEWFKKANIHLNLDTTVEKIDISKKTVYAKKEDKNITENFDSLIISTGAKPSFPPIKNIDLKGVFSLRTIDDAKKIKSFAKKDTKATIVGAGLIGMEMADNLFKMGLKVTIVEALENILATNLDKDMSKLVSNEVPDEIKIYTNHLATKAEDKNGTINSIVIKNKDNNEEQKIETNLLIVATGTKPETSLAEKIGCKIGKTKAIIVNNKSETNIPRVYAVGDCTEYVGYITKKPILVGLGSIVVRQGIAAGTNAAGGKYVLPKGFLNTFTSEFFDKEIAGVGVSSACRDLDYISAKYNGESLPHYFPGGKKISIKVYADKKTEKIIGAQSVGDKAAQRINTFAAAIMGNLDINTFRKLETAYAPPIAPTLDAETLVCDILDMKLKRKR